ncbi:hypothetical protein CABS01_06981, partial [Colletotrichum abscissum]|uniref:uncharacterized protein n=1 Tax=Colletotrichum abscissum TaxID=1671311 RepID=UPI0027D5F8BE
AQPRTYDIHVVTSFPDPTRPSGPRSPSPAPPPPPPPPPPTHPNTTSADCDPWTVTLHRQHHPSIITIPDITARHQPIAPIRIGTPYYLLSASDDQ